MNAQDDLFAKMAHLSSKKQEGLREGIYHKLVKEDFRELEGMRETYKPVIDSILQQVIEWVELRKGKYGDQSKYDEALNDLISRLKEEKA